VSNADPELRELIDIIDKLAKYASYLPIFVPIVQRRQRATISRG
jgi:hypothetical protein